MDRNKAEVFTPNYGDSVNGRGQIGTEEKPWAEGWFADIRYIVQPGSSSSMSGNETFTDTKSNLTIYARNPNGANRTFTPSGSFRDRTLIILINTGSSYNITLIATGVDGRVTPGKTGIFVYLGASDGWKRILL